MNNKVFLDNLKVNFLRCLIVTNIFFFLGIKAFAAINYPLVIVAIIFGAPFVLALFMTWISSIKPKRLFHRTIN